MEHFVSLLDLFYLAKSPWKLKGQQFQKQKKKAIRQTFCLSHLSDRWDLYTNLTNRGDITRPLAGCSVPRHLTKLTKTSQV